MDSDLSWMQKPPELLGEEALEASRAFARKANVPTYVEGVDQARPAARESVIPAPVRLSRDKLWVFPALLYTMVGLDKSLFELYTLQFGVEIPVVSYRADRPVVGLLGAEAKADSWFGVLQGVDPVAGRAALTFLETFTFRNPRNGLEWSVTANSQRMADPFAAGSGIDVELLLPRCLTRNRRVVVVQDAGLDLRPVVLGAIDG